MNRKLALALLTVGQLINTQEGTVEVVHEATTLTIATDASEDCTTTPDDSTCAASNGVPTEETIPTIKASPSTTPEEEKKGLVDIAALDALIAGESEPAPE